MFAYLPRESLRQGAEASYSLIAVYFQMLSIHPSFAELSTLPNWPWMLLIAIGFQYAGHGV
jgi:hypothetical protein